jgi:hypothetical protein
LPTEEFYNSTLNAEEILSHQERGDTNKKASKWGMLGAACRLASFDGQIIIILFLCQKISKKHIFCDSNYV